MPASHQLAIQYRIKAGRVTRITRQIHIFTLSLRRAQLIHFHFCSVVSAAAVTKRRGSSFIASDAR